MKRLFAAALMMAACAPAQADPRIATRFYQASSIVTLHGRAGIETTIVFAPDERIENIAVGNPAAWQVTPNKRANLLFVRPSGVGAHTNMTVITDQRSYLFDLVSRTGSAPVYMLRFSYPPAPKPSAATLAATAEAAALTVVKTAPPIPAATPADLNFDWSFRGDKRLAPARSFDDGRSTFLQWPRDVALPAILVREGKGVEGPLNYTVQGAYIVVEGVPSELILRVGKQVATLTSPPRPVPKPDTAVLVATTGAPQ